MSSEKTHTYFPFLQSPKQILEQHHEAAMIKEGQPIKPGYRVSQILVIYCSGIRQAMILKQIITISWAYLNSYSPILVSSCTVLPRKSIEFLKFRTEVVDSENPALFVTIVVFASTEDAGYASQQPIRTGFAV